MIKEHALELNYFGLLNQVVYAPQYYYSKTVKRDEYSFKIVQSKHKDCSEYFFPKLTGVVDELKRDGKLENIDLITIIPSHECGGFSPTLDALGHKLSAYLGVGYDKVLVKIKPDESKCKPADEKYMAVHNSMKINNSLDQIRKVLLLDDVKVTGVTILEAKSKMNECGVKELVCICLGINKSADFIRNP